MTKKLTPEESRLWKLNTQDVKLLKKNLAVSKKIASSIARDQHVIRKTPSSEISPSVVSTPLPCLDRRSLRNFSIEACLDMHGLTLEKAYQVLENFLRNAQERNIKTILVITGKGNLLNENTLRGQLPRWLEQTPLRHLVSALHHPAKLQDGGTGAFYVRVRRKDQRPPSRPILPKKS